MRQKMSPTIRCGIPVEPGSGCDEGNGNKTGGEPWDGNVKFLNRIIFI
jgi:hypothetical protein